MEIRERLNAQLRELEEKIQEAEQRLPAHSAKPPTMQMLLALEDERDAVLARLKALEAGSKDKDGMP